MTLAILEAIGERSDVTQRHLATRLGIALGLANSYLRRCVRTGLVKVQQAPANRYLYYLTPKGFTEKGRLTAEYFTSSFGFYRTAADACLDLLRRSARDGCGTALLCGISELGEIARLKALEADIEVVGFYDCGATAATFLGLPVWRDLGRCAPADVWVLTDLVNPERTRAEMTAQAREARVEVPAIPRYAWDG